MPAKPAGLTAVDFLQGEVFLQIPPELHLIAVLAHGAVISQNEVRVHAVEGGELAERVAQGLIEAHHLRRNKRGSARQPFSSFGCAQTLLCASIQVQEQKTTSCSQQHSSDCWWGRTRF